MDIKIRPVTLDDAEGVLEVLNSVIQERKYSSFDSILTVEEERQFIASLGERSGFFVAELDDHIIGFQSIEPFATYNTSAMDHVGIMGTFVHADFRGQGIGRQLAEASFKFAQDKSYEKVVIYVRTSNKAAQEFYQEMGFVPRGTLEKQVKIDGEYDDEVFMEMFLEVEEEEFEEEVERRKKVMVRRAKRRDIPAITVIMNGLLGEGTLTESDVMQKIFEKAYWVAVGEKAGGVAGWQAENLVACIDEFSVYPHGYWEKVGGPLLETIEAAAHELSCEVSIIFVAGYHPQEAVEFFASRGYERQELEDLIKIWREVASEFMIEDRFLMLKKLREKRIMQPI